jgi:cytochrome c oxidase cbb3-type subunit IV
MEYQTAAYFAETYGLLYLFVLFIGVLVYALWPGNKKKFRDAASIPLKED